MKRSLFMSMIVAALAFALAMPLYAGGKAAPAGTITMQPSAGKATKKPAKFSHKSHAAAKCAECHHHKAGSNEYAKCDSKGCHDDMTAKTGAKSYYAAFHSNNPKSCVGCHKKAANPKAPTACNKCHA